ncbi:5360_t:CDS:2 [Ambispora leptoticha]|uniref:5360_t:CDS:1 n=1 Tax=Ambispora leptoticha TaxID=144679 RepID=A0A9N9DIA1_9GLOM|nr:5360_t:CDS:2 [Ambispora leptoticha]
MANTQPKINLPELVWQRFEDLWNEEKCTQVLLGEKPIIEYRPPFLNGLELDAFFQKYQIALEVQEAQHRLHSTSWYKDVKKLENTAKKMYMPK